MAGSRADPLPFGCRILCANELSGPASHDGTGQRYVLIPPESDGFVYALDVERRDLPNPTALAAVLGPLAIQRWGEIEVMAKLLDTPAHLILRQVLAVGVQVLMAENGLAIIRQDSASLWCVIGRRPLNGEYRKVRGN